MDDIHFLDALATDYGRVFLRLHRLVDRRMAREGASLARTKLLMCLDREGPMRGTDIAELFGLAQRSVTDALDGLERANLVQRTPDPVDRRVKQVSITAEGKAAFAATEPLRLSMIENVFGVLSPEDREQLLRIVNLLLAQVEAVAQNADAGSRE